VHEVRRLGDNDGVAASKELEKSVARIVCSETYSVPAPKEVMRWRGHRADPACEGHTQRQKVLCLEKR
jgi:hypothetical protein